MMPSDYQALDGSTQVFDLDEVVSIFDGQSQTRPGWNALLVYVPRSKVFIELRSSPPNVHGDSDDEAQEVSEQTLLEDYRITPAMCAQIRQNPRAWVLIDERKEAIDLSPPR